MKKKHRGIVVDGIAYVWIPHRYGTFTVYDDKKKQLSHEVGESDACLPRYVAGHIKQQQYHKDELSKK